MRSQPDHAAAHHNLGLVFEEQGRPRDAVAEFEEAVRPRPRQVRYRCDLALALEESGDAAGAQQQYAAALTLDPSWPETWNQAAAFLAGHADSANRHARRSLRLARQACAASQNLRPEFLQTLAAAYAALGCRDQALATAKTALARARDTGTSPIPTQCRSATRSSTTRRPSRWLTSITTDTRI